MGANLDEWYTRYSRKGTALNFIRTSDPYGGEAESQYWRHFCRVSPIGAGGKGAIVDAS